MASTWALYTAIWEICVHRYLYIYLNIRYSHTRARAHTHTHTHVLFIIHVWMVYIKKDICRFASIDTQKLPHTHWLSIGVLCTLTIFSLAALSVQPSKLHFVYIRQVRPYFYFKGVYRKIVLYVCTYIYTLWNNRNTHFAS